MNRRHLLSSANTLFVAALIGCARSSDVPPTVATDAGLIASGLAGAFKDIPAVPSAIVVALDDLASAALALADADVIASAQPLVQRVEADVNAVVAAVGTLSLPANATSAIQAAQVLLAVIEAGVDLVVTASGARGTMASEPARLVLATAAVR